MFLLILCDKKIDWLIDFCLEENNWVLIPIKNLIELHVLFMYLFIHLYILLCIFIS